MHLCFPLSKYILHQIWAVEVAMGKFEAVKDEGEFMIWYNSLVLYAVQVGVCACAYESCQVLVFTQFQMNCWNVNIQLLLPDPDRGAWYLFASLPISLLLTWMTLTLTLTLTVFVYICLIACLVCQGICMLVCVCQILVKSLILNLMNWLNTATTPVARNAARWQRLYFNSTQFTDQIRMNTYLLVLR